MKERGKENVCVNMFLRASVCVCYLQREKGEGRKNEL